MSFQKHYILSVTAVFALLAGCSSEAPKDAAKKEAKPIAAVSGQSAAFEMYKTARSWNKDATLLRLENLDIPEAKAEPGKYGAWKATFVSFEKKRRRGADADPEADPYNGLTPVDEALS
jgi:hypothetical protein